MELNCTLQLVFQFPGFGIEDFVIPRSPDPAEITESADNMGYLSLQSLQSSRIMPFHGP